MQRALAALFGDKKAFDEMHKTLPWLDGPTPQMEYLKLLLRDGLIRSAAEFLTHPARLTPSQ